jgi:hypothetical protein
MRLEGQYATRNAALLGFPAQQRQHGLVAPVDAVEVTDRYRAGAGNFGVVETAKNLHGFVIFLIAGCAHRTRARRQFVMETLYIVTQSGDWA